jgi:hypothetical protein
MPKAVSGGTVDLVAKHGRGHIVGGSHGVVVLLRVQPHRVPVGVRHLHA